MRGMCVSSRGGPGLLGGCVGRWREWPGTRAVRRVSFAASIRAVLCGWAYWSRGARSRFGCGVRQEEGTGWIDFERPSAEALRV